MPRAPLTPAPSGNRGGVTVAWNASGERCFHAVVSLHLPTTRALELQRGDKAMVEHCAETNRIWIRRADPGEHSRAWAILWKRSTDTNSAATLRLTLPGIHGDKRPAQPCEHTLRVTPAGPELEIQMPAWAQPPSARRNAMKAA